MKNPAIKYGLILGFISVFVQWLLYAAGDEVMATWWVGILWILVLLVLIVVFSLRMRKEKGGYWSFKQAFIAIVIMCSISGFFSSANNVIMYGVIDPELSQRMKEVMIQKTTVMMERFDAPQEKIDETIEKMQSQPSQFEPVNIVKGFFWGLIIAAVLALIIAAIIKKEPPVIDNNSLDSNTNTPSAN